MYFFAKGDYLSNIVKKSIFCMSFGGLKIFVEMVIPLGHCGVLEILS